MLPLLVFLVSLGQFYTNVDSNAITDGWNSYTYADADADRKASNIDNIFFAKLLDNIPLVKLDPEKTLVKYQRPFTAVNIDFEKNAVLSKFRKEDELLEPDEKFLNSGKRQLEKYNEEDDEDDERRNERSTSGARDPRGDNFMRFGRSPHEDFMRFGRAPHEDFMRFGRDRGADFFRLGRSLRTRRDPGSDFMRLGRSPSRSFSKSTDRDIAEDFMRFGRSPQEDFMRFGRSVKWNNGDSSNHKNRIEKGLELPKNVSDRIYKNEPTSLLESKSANVKNMPQNTQNAY